MGIDSKELICNMGLAFAGVNQGIDSIDDPSAAAIACKTFYQQYLEDLFDEYAWPFAIRRIDLVPYSGPPWDSGTVYSAGDLVQLGATVYRGLNPGTMGFVNQGYDPRFNPQAWQRVTRDGYGFVCPLPDDVSQVLEIWVTPIADPNTVPLTYAQQPAPPIRTPRSNERGVFRIEDANDGLPHKVLLTDIQSPTIRYTANISDTTLYSHHFIISLAWRLAGPLCMALRADVNVAAALEKKAALVLADSIATEARGERTDPEPVSEFEAARER